MLRRNTLPLLFLLFTTVLVCLVAELAPAPQIDRQAVNPVLGDLSFTARYGQSPDAATDENLRIRTHLAYAEDRLRHTPAPHLSAAEQAQRSHALDLLHDYWVAGIFPRNYDYKGERRPCFIDRDGRICAVGYLVEQTAGRAAAEAINQKHQYEDLLAMNEPALDEWITGSGLSKTECAMIQPTYGWADPTNNYVSRGQSIATASFTGINLSINLLNGIQLLNSKQRTAIPVIGLVTGVGQVALGIGMTPDRLYSNLSTNYPERQHQLSMMNIGLGASSILLSTYNLVANRKPKEKPVTWNVYGYPTSHQSMAMGFGLSKRF